MRSIGIVLLISLLLFVACTHQEYTFSYTGILPDEEIVDSDLNVISRCRVFYQGIPAMTVDPAFLDSLHVESREAELRIDNIGMAYSNNIEVMWFTSDLDHDLYTLMKKGTKLLYHAADGFVTYIDDDAATSGWIKGERENALRDLYNWLYHWEQARNADTTTFLILDVEFPDEMTDLGHQYLTRIQDIIMNMADIWVGIFYHQNPEKFLEKYHQNSRLSSLILFGKKGSYGKPESNYEYVETMIDNISKSELEIEYSVEQIASPVLSKLDVLISSYILGNPIDRTITLPVDQAVIRNTYTRILRQNALQMVTNGMCVQAMDEVASACTMYQLSEACEIIKEILTSWKDSRDKTPYWEQDYQEMQSMYTRVEQCSPNCQDLTDFVQPWFEAYLDFLLTGDNYERQLEVCRIIGVQDPDNLRFQSLEHVIQGDINRSNGNIATALGNYAKAIELQPESIGKTRLSDLLNGSIPPLYKNGQYSLLCELAQRYSPYVASTFSNHYYIGSAADKAHWEKMAIKHYSWLLDHWSRNQKLIQWDNLLIKMLDLHARNLAFENAFGLLKRLCLEGKIHDKKLIQQAAFFNRYRYLTPFLRTGSKLFEIHPGAHQNLKNMLNPVVLPDFISAIYMTGGSRTYTFYQNDDARIIFTTGKGNFIRQMNTDWLQVPVGNRVLCIQCDKCLLPEEEILMNEIQKDLSSVEKWNMLEQHYFGSGRQAMVSLLTAILSCEYLDFGLANIRNYASQMAEIEGLHYWCIQNEKNMIVYSRGFDRQKLKMDDTHWAVTSQAQLLHETDTVYNDKKIIDIAYPMYDSQWRGVFRVGIEK